MSELDHDGVETRKSRNLHKRKYIWLRPNEVWHADGNDKLKSFRFSIVSLIVKQYEEL